MASAADSSTVARVALRAVMPVRRSVIGAASVKSSRSHRKALTLTLGGSASLRVLRSAFASALGSTGTDRCVRRAGVLLASRSGLDGGGAQRVDLGAAVGDHAQLGLQLHLSRGDLVAIAPTLKVQRA
jgi:hypothetical protein